MLNKVRQLIHLAICPLLVFYLLAYVSGSGSTMLLAPEKDSRIACMASAVAGELGEIVDSDTRSCFEPSNKPILHALLPGRALAASAGRATFLHASAASPFIPDAASGAIVIRGPPSFVCSE